MTTIEELRAHFEKSQNELIAMIKTMAEVTLQILQERPQLGQRCHVEGQGFGTILKLEFRGHNNQPHAYVDHDNDCMAWHLVTDLELLQTNHAE